MAVVSSTFHNVFPVPGYTETTIARGMAPEGDSLIRGDEIAAEKLADVTNRVNPGNFPGLGSDVAWFSPRGNRSGKLDASLLDRPIDPVPRSANGEFEGVAPEGPGLDRTASFRGAFRRDAPRWTTGWTVLSNAGLLADE